MLWDNPYLIARPLASAKANDAFDGDDVVYAVLFCLYGNLFTPREEQAVLRILEVRTLGRPQQWRDGPSDGAYHVPAWPRTHTHTHTHNRR